MAPRARTSPSCSGCWTSAAADGDWDQALRLRFSPPFLSRSCSLCTHALPLRDLFGLLSVSEREGKRRLCDERYASDRHLAWRQVKGGEKTRLIGIVRFHLI